MLRHVTEREMPERATAGRLYAPRAAAADGPAEEWIGTQVRRDPAQKERCSRPQRHQQPPDDMLQLLAQQRTKANAISRSRAAEA